MHVVAVGRRVDCGGQREHALCPQQMRPVEHAAAVRDDAGARGGGERGDDGPGRADGVGRRLERAIQDLDLVGVDGELAGKAVALRRRGAFASPSRSVKSV